MVHVLMREASHQFAPCSASGASPSSGWGALSRRSPCSQRCLSLGSHHSPAGFQGVFFLAC